MGFGRSSNRFASACCRRSVRHSCTAVDSLHARRSHPFAGMDCERTGIFARNGLDVQIIRAQAAVATDVAHFRRSGGFYPGGRAHSCLEQLEWIRNGYAVQWYVGLDYWLSACRRLKMASSLKGRHRWRIGLTGASFIASQLALKKLGLNPSNTFRSSRGRHSRTIGGIAQRPHPSHFVKSADYLHGGATGLSYLSRCGATCRFKTMGSSLREIIREQPNVVRRYVKSQIEAVHIMKKMNIARPA